MMTGWLHGPMFRLNIVVMSSLAFLAYGFNPPFGVIEVLQLPVAGLQVNFILAVLLQTGARGFVAPLTSLERGLIATLLAYMFAVSVMSPLPSAQILILSWVIHVLFFVALISFLQNVGPEQAEMVWSVIGVTALIHVCVFLLALIIWPGDIAQMRIPAFGNVRHLGYLLAPAAAVMAVRFATRPDGAVICLACFSFAAFYLIYTGSRGGVAALLAGIAASGVYLIWHRQTVDRSKIAALLVTTAVLTLISELLPSLPWPPLVSRWIFDIGHDELEIIQGRRAIWALAASTIQLNPVFGYGPILLSEVPNYEISKAYYQPHNIGLQLLLHWGLAGTSIIFGTAISFSPNVKTALRDKPDKSILPLAAISTICVHAIVDGVLFYPFSIAIAIIALALLDALGRQQADSPDPKEKKLPFGT